MKNIAIFASGEGTNAEKILEHFRGNKNIRVAIIMSNCADANVLEKAKKFGVEYFVFGKNDFYESDAVLNKLNSLHLDLIVLAGFLWLIPKKLIESFPKKIINIHPALLPKHGGKGMYGIKVHESVLANKENETGITIHYVNEHFDEGKIIFQAKCEVEKNDTAETLADKVHELEHRHYPRIIEDVISNI